jgi:membrane-associated phospholipid phosphatase
VAAMPSLHLATSLLIAMLGIRWLHSRWRWLLLTYPVAMGMTLVYCAEHYIMDLLAGVVLAVIVMAVLAHVESWWLEDSERRSQI